MNAKTAAGRGFLFGWKARIWFGNFISLTLQARPSHRLTIVAAAENHFLANHNHDIANQRIPITPDRNFRRRVFVSHGGAVALDDFTRGAMAPSSHSYGLPG